MVDRATKTAATNTIRPSDISPVPSLISPANKKTPRMKLTTNTIPRRYLCAKPRLRSVSSRCAVLASRSSHQRSVAVPFAIAAYITAAYWFTSSTSFANLAVIIARSLSDTFTGIRSLDVVLFVAVEFSGALAATCLFRWRSRFRQPREANSCTLGSPPSQASRRHGPAESLATPSTPA
jgi:hypothetical protein